MGIGSSPSRDRGSSRRSARPPARGAGGRSAIGAVLACAVLAITCSVSVPSFAAAGPATPPCTTAGTLAWIPHGLGDGTAGSIYYELWFTNLSGRACTLSGFPSVTAVGLAGKRIGGPAGREPGRPPRLVRLAPDASARAQLRIVDAGAITPSACRPRTAAGLRVRLPGGGAPRLVPLAFEACARGSGVLTVGPFRPTE